MPRLFTIKKVFYGLFVIILTLMVGCQQKPELEGKVVDASQHPLSGITVRIGGSTWVTTTNGDGKYTIPFAPGKITVIYSGHCYKNQERKIEVTSPVLFPMEPVVMEPNFISIKSPLIYKKGFQPLEASYYSKTKKKWDFSGKLNYYYKDNRVTIRFCRKDLTYFVFEVKPVNLSELITMKRLTLDQGTSNILILQNPETTTYVHSNNNGAGRIYVYYPIKGKYINHSLKEQVANNVLTDAPAYLLVVGKLTSAEENLIQKIISE